MPQKPGGNSFNFLEIYLRRFFFCTSKTLPLPKLELSLQYIQICTEIISFTSYNGIKPQEINKVIRFLIKSQSCTFLNETSFLDFYCTNTQFTCFPNKPD